MKLEMVTGTLTEKRGTESTAERELFQVMCDITGEAIPEEPALKWNEEEMTKLHDLESKIGSNLVLQDIRKGATRPEDYSPTPSFTGMQARLLVTAKAGHRASAFSYADLPKEQQVVCYRSVGESGTQVPYLVLTSLYGLRQAPSLWAKALGEAPGEIGYTRSKLDQGVFCRGTPNGRSYCVVHVDDID
eukprot:1127634-Amphidinium_carterae.3